jgi:hypothetical protein
MASLIFLLVEDKVFFPGCTHIGTRVHHIRYARACIHVRAYGIECTLHDSFLSVHGRRSVMNKAMQYIYRR